MTAMDTLAPQKAEQTIFALIATWLAKGTRAIVADFPTITQVNGFRTFTFEGQPYNVVARAEGDLLINPGVNVYFGAHTPDARHAKPQIVHLPVMVHVTVPWSNQAMSAAKLAMRIGSTMEMAFEGSMPRVQVCDCTQSPPVPTSYRFVSWAHSTRGTWNEAGDPTKGVFTNRIWTREFRYLR